MGPQLNVEETQKQMVPWLLTKRLQIVVLLFLPQSSTGGNGEKQKIPLRCPKELEGMGFIAGSRLGLHALKYSLVSFVLLVKPFPPSEGLICFMAIFFSASDSSHLHHSLWKEAVYIKFINYLHKFSLVLLLKLDAGL